ncbi:MAG TPA: hypothetical protein V6C69_14380 [Trichormus sp.]
MARIRGFGGPLAIAGILLLSTEGGRKVLKSLTKEAAKVGVAVYDKVKELTAEVREEATQLIEEAKAERNNGKNGNVALKATEDK